ncbi:MAG: AAA family ATPase [Solobacterium sp.]|nr:AAA family ATPase [Solobacterium sp.]
MGIYVNPSNTGFLEVLNTGRYIDKTGLIAFFNSVLSTRDKEIVFTRPRRFGKTTACRMLAAYYSEGCDSEALFKGLEIEKDPSFKKHLNQYPVICFDLIRFMLKKDKNKERDITKTVEHIETTLVNELMQEYPDASLSKDMELAEALMAVSRRIGRRFIIICDEYDMLIREAKDNQALIRDYIDFLRSLFRSSDTSTYLAGAYMTGILPIIKYNTQSALSDFREYTMLNPWPLGKYIGFTADEVHTVCQKFNADEFRMKEWYDGYRLKGVGDVYCPNSVMLAATRRKFSSYWTATSAMEAVADYIYLNIDGLQDAVNDLLDGKEIVIDTDMFANRLDYLETKNDVLTVLVHLSYLAYDPMRRSVRIPNFEVRIHMLKIFSKSVDPVFLRRIKRCEEVIQATVEGDNKTLASLFEEIHNERPPRYYNDEQALRYVVLAAYNNSPLGNYITFEELSSGKGYVDILFMPQKGFADPPILVELKSGASAGKAITQIHEKDYISFLKKIEYHGDVMLVGVNYSQKTKKHNCRIEKITL